MYLQKSQNVNNKNKTKMLLCNILDPAAAEGDGGPGAREDDS